jgi:hypothetical protein
MKVSASKVFFVVSSGRSGTAMLHKALSASPGVEMHHEYMVHHLQPLAVRRYLGLADAAAARAVLSQTTLASIRCSQALHWGDSSNKLSWLIPDLAALFPHAKFVHLVRDGRKVAGSFFRKLADECYDDRSTAILRAHLEDSALPAPPPEKKYWWPQPRKDDPGALAFKSYTQFERIAWHWSEINRVILQDLGALPQKSLLLRLEELRESPAVLRALFDFLELDFREDTFALFARPHNVNRPVDMPLDEMQRVAFQAIAGAMMDRLGYSSRPEYVVNY